MAAERPPLGPQTELRWLPGVGPTRAGRLARLGLATVGDLLRHLPHRYEDLTARPALNDVRAGQSVTVRGRVTEVAPREGPRWRGGPEFACTVADATGALRAVWFHRTRATRLCTAGAEVVLAGTAAAFRGRPQLMNPVVETPAEADAALTDTGGLRPVYPATEGLPPALLRRLVNAALGAATQMPDPLPVAIRQRRRLAPLGEAIAAVHRPSSPADAARARARLAYDELLALQVLLGLRRRSLRAARKTVLLHVSPKIEARIRARLPFTLTPGQEKVVAEIRADLVAPAPMHRLLQGDVGSGKTAVAAYAMLVAVANRAQAALLAPTEVLAEQHHATLSAMLAGTTVTPALLHGGTSKRTRTTICAGLADGSIALVVGTHALLEPDVRFRRLAVLVVDEQQRFGVEQKAAAVEKGVRPDVLVTTATPIPRALALTLFGDLDVSSLVGFPPGRVEVATHWKRKAARAEVLAAIRAAAADTDGRVFVVAPAIEASAAAQVRSAEALAVELRAALPGVPVGLLHGRLARTKRVAVMDAFRSGELRVLAATTVIEVGVDVPQATLMVIEDADRFGLAQLHQLRGRVGRGGKPGTCLLVADPTTPEAEERLEVLCKTRDGFRIAEADLRLRGAGEMLGLRQSGLGDFRVARLPEDLRLLTDARDDAARLLAADPLLRRPEHQALKAAIAERFPEGWRLAGVA